MPMVMPTYGGARGTWQLRAPGTAAPSGWNDLGQNATIAATAQPPVSRIIVQLQPYRGRVFLGYGEWDRGLGNCDLLAWNTATEAFETVAARIATDAFWSLRVVDDALWALATDPSVGTDPDAVVVAGNNVRVMASGAVAPWHLFDVREWAGALYLAGANRVGAESHATVWRSSDGGGSWAVVLDIPDNQRIYGLFVLADRLYAVGRLGTAWKTADGASWTPVAQPLLRGESECIRPWTLGGYAVYLAGWPAFGAQSLYAFDGRKVRPVADPWSVHDAFCDGESLVILTADGKVKRTEDLATWTVVATGAPDEARSLCLAGETIYLGTTDSRLWCAAL
jgi:hypothetical protein